MHSQTNQISKMELFAKIVSSILDVQLGSEYAFVMLPKHCALSENNVEIS